MQLSRRRADFGHRWVLGAGLALIVGPGTATPSYAFLDWGVDEQNDTYIFQYFSDVDDIHVYTNKNSYDITLDNDTALQMQLLHQTVVVPAVEAPPGSEEAVDAITTASRPIRSVGDAYNEYARTRKEGTLDVRHRAISAGYYMSTEEDYFAQMVRASVDRDFLGQTLNLSAGASYGWDSIEPLEDADTQTAADHRNTTYVNFVVTQILSPTTVLRVGAEQFWVDGLQHNPYRNVYVDGANVPEQHPETRSRRDLYLRVHQYLPNRASLKVSYKYYFDDWGVASQTIGSRLSQYVTDNVVVRYRYRFYSQGAADFYRDEYTVPGGIDGFQTGDYRMGDFSAHLFGTRLSWSLQDRFADTALLGQLQLELSYERYFNSNNFSANIFEAGFNLGF